jgi:hypothetical protein
MTDAKCSKSMKSQRCVICFRSMASELGVRFLDYLWRNRSRADGSAKCADFSRSTPNRCGRYSRNTLLRIAAALNGERDLGRLRDGALGKRGLRSPRSSGYASRRGRGRSGRNASIRNSRGDSGVMHYAVVREPRSAGIGETCRVQPALGDMPPAIETAAPQEARRS